MAVDLIVLGIAFMYSIGALQIALVLMYVAQFEFSIGPILWVYMSETMTDKGLSIGTLVNWVMTIIIAIITPILLDAIGGWLFIIFGIICVVLGAFSLFVVKETKGLSEVEVAQLYNREKKVIVAEEV